MYIIEPIDFGSFSKYKRINVMGNSGMGKTSFAKSWAAIQSQVRACDHIEMDGLIHLPGWIERSAEEYAPLAEARLAAANCFVFDGKYRKINHIKYKYVDAVVYLDYSARINAYRALTRSVKRAFDSKELWPGTECRESFKKTFLSTNSILKHQFKGYRKQKDYFKHQLPNEIPDHIPVFHLTNPKQADYILEVLRQSVQTK